MDILDKKQYKHICDMLKAQGRPLTKESIATYLRQNKHQLKKLALNVERKRQNWELKQYAYLQNILFRFKIFNRWFVVYKWGMKGKFFSIDILRSKGEF